VDEVDFVARNETQYTFSNYAPGSGLGEVDIRGYDNYPLRMYILALSMWGVALDLIGLTSRLHLL